MRRLQQLFRLLPGTTCGQHELIDHHLLAESVHFFRHVLTRTRKIAEEGEATTGAGHRCTAHDPPVLAGSGSDSSFRSDAGAAYERRPESCFEN